MDGQKLRKKLAEEKQYYGIQNYKLHKIENDMLEKTASLLRMYFGDSKSTKECKYKEQLIEEVVNFEESLADMKKMVSNYKMPELMIYIMWQTHSNWIEDNIETDDLERSDEAYKFAPFVLLDWNTVNDQYFRVLAPIFDHLDIEYDISAVKKKCDESCNKFLKVNNINSIEDLNKRMKDNIVGIYPDLGMAKNSKGERIINILSKDKIVDNICKQVQKRKLLFKNKQIEDDFCR